MKKAVTALMAAGALVALAACGGNSDNSSGDSGSSSEKVTLKFSLPGEAHEIVCDGEIVNAKELGMGVSFVNLKDPDRVRIQKLIDFHLRQAPPVPAEKPKASPKTSGRGASTSGAKPAARNSKTGIPAVKAPPPKK